MIEAYYWYSAGVNSMDISEHSPNIPKENNFCFLFSFIYRHFHPFHHSFIHSSFHIFIIFSPKNSQLPCPFSSATYGPGYVSRLPCRPRTAV